MKIELILSLVLAIVIISITLLASLDKSIPNELIVILGTISTYLVGTFTKHPTNLGD